MQRGDTQATQPLSYVIIYYSKTSKAKLGKDSFHLLFASLYSSYYGSDGKESAFNVETQVWSLGKEDPPGEGNGNLLQYSCLENSMDSRAWWATVHGIAKSQTCLSN